MHVFHVPVPDLMCFCWLMVKLAHLQKCLLKCVKKELKESITIKDLTDDRVGKSVKQNLM